MMVVNVKVGPAIHVWMLTSLDFRDEMSHDLTTD